MSRPSDEALAVHRLLAADPKMLATMRAAAQEASPRPKEEAHLVWWLEGRRSAYAELVSLYDEVENMKP